MQHLARYWKLFLNAEYRENEGLDFGKSCSLLVVSAVCLFLLITSVGREILYTLAVFAALIAGMFCLYSFFDGVFKVVKNYQKVKVLWEIEEEFR